MVFWTAINRMVTIPPVRVTKCDNANDDPIPVPPPKLRQIESPGEKLWRKVTAQPLVPIGCIATAYFLASGIKSFRNRDPVRSQKMMQARVMAQFVTLLCFIGYVGLDNADFRIAPMFQDVKKWNALQEEEQQQQNTSTQTNQQESK